MPEKPPKSRSNRRVAHKRFPLRMPLAIYMHFNSIAYEADISLNEAIMRVLKEQAKKTGAIVAPLNAIQ